MPTRVSISPTVSICVPTHNGAEYLRDCLDSALAQTWEDFELLVVDDGSRDESVAIAREYARRDPRVRVHVNVRNLGLVDNWNHCVSLARGAWIKLLFQDDLLDKTCLTRMLEDSRPDVPMAVVRRRIAFEPGSPDAVRAMYEPFESRWTVTGFFGPVTRVAAGRFAEHLVGRPLTNCVGEPTAVLWHRSAFQRFGRFNADLLVLADWEFSARVAIHTGFTYSDEELATFRVHGRSATQTRIGARAFRVQILDGLIMEHDMGYAAMYAPARRAAAGLRAPVDLAHRLVESVAEARRELRERVRLGQDPHARSDWSDVLRRYPRLRSVPAGYRIAHARRVGREARWAFLHRVERLAGRLTSALGVGR